MASETDTTLLTGLANDLELVRELKGDWSVSTRPLIRKACNIIILGFATRHNINSVGRSTNSVPIQAYKTVVKHLDDNYLHVLPAADREFFLQYYSFDNEQEYDGVSLINKDMHHLISIVKEISFVEPEAREDSYAPIWKKMFNEVDNKVSNLESDRRRQSVKTWQDTLSSLKDDFGTEEEATRKINNMLKERRYLLGTIRMEVLSSIVEPYIESIRIIRDHNKSLAVMEQEFSAVKNHIKEKYNIVVE